MILYLWDSTDKVFRRAECDSDGKLIISDADPFTLVQDTPEDLKHTPHGYYPTGGTYHPFQVDANGKLLITLSSLAELDDIDDVDVAAPTDLYIVYWNDTNSKWECRAFDDWHLAALHELGGAAAFDVTGLSGLLADQQTPLIHGIDKHTDRTRYKFWDVKKGWIVTGTEAALGDFVVAQAAANTVMTVRFTKRVPDNFVSFTALHAVWSSPAGAGNANWRILADYGASGEVYNTHTETGGYIESATGGANKINVSNSGLALASLALGDKLGLNYYWRADNVLDTLDDVSNFLGLLFEYIGDS